MANVVHVLLIVGSLWLIWLCTDRGFRAFVWPQRARFAALAIGAAIAAGDQVERYGLPLSWRVVPHALLIGLGIWGVRFYDPLKDERT